MEQRSGACDWNNLDSNGRMNIPGGGGDHTPDECFNWCTNEPKCVWAALSDIGYGHGYQTCNHEPGGRGFILKQKVCKGVWAALSDIGYCHGYQTCNHEPGGRGFILKQKVCKGVWEYSNRNGCEEVMD